MTMRLMVDQLKGTADDRAQSGRIVALHRQARAFLRPVRREGRDDGMAAGLHAADEAAEIGPPIVLLDQEMEGGAIVPEVEGVLRLFPCRDISRDPSQMSAGRPKPLPRAGKRRLGQIKHGDGVIATLAES